MSKWNRTAIVACTLAALIVFAGTGYAAARARASLLVKVDSGGTTFSTDEGETWSSVVPEGVTVAEDGHKVTVIDVPNGGSETLTGTMTANGDGILVTHGSGSATPGESKMNLVRAEDGVMYFSNNNGETWTTTPPDGLTVREAGNGRTVVTMDGGK